LVCELTWRLCSAGPSRYEPVFEYMQGVGCTGDGGDDRSDGFEAKHAAIIATTLRWADEAAARHDYAQALRWIDTVESLGQTLPSDYEAKRRGWLDAV
jgi:hypothetical protein